MKLVKALKGEFLESIPFWFMRQAGRYLPEYNQTKGKKNFLEIIQDVDLATHISIQPYLRFRTDGIIIFADILTPYIALKIPISFEDNGPNIKFNIYSEKDKEKLLTFNPEESLVYLKNIIKNIKNFIDKENQNISLIGFAGAPFTMLSYLIENGINKKLEKTKEFLFNFEEASHNYMEILAKITIEYLKFQILNGVDLVQIFDSWGGILSPSHYKEFCFPYIKRIVEEIKKLVPVIVFIGNNSHLLELLIELKPSCISLDWRIDTIEKIPEEIGIQGNLDPVILLGKEERVRREVQEILDRFSKRRRFIFNLGHGILPNTPLHNVYAMIETIKKYKRKDY